MSDGIESITTRTLSLALDAAVLRHRAIASNVAHHATAGYRAQQVDFEAQLLAARADLDRRGSADAASLAGVRPRTVAAGASEAVQVDEQMADMARNAVHFQALVRVLQKHFALLHGAAREGRS